MNTLVLLICGVLFFTGVKLEKDLRKEGHDPVRLLKASHGIKDRYAKPFIGDATKQQILDFESVDRDRREEYDATKAIEAECRKVRQSPTWDGEECWIEVADGVAVSDDQDA